ncbi:MAG: 2'-5' RNA ligase family protein [Alphaproteobacteria bacterium]
MAGALIVLVELGAPDFAWFDQLRWRHYPPDRNRVPAHLTLFRALPPSAEDEVRRSLARAASRAPPEARTSGVMDLGEGVALRVDSLALDRIRAELAGEFHGLLSSQDSGPWTAHVTIQNKAEPTAVRALLREMREGFEPRPIRVRGLQLVRYAEGGWEPIAAYRFRG